MYKMISALFVCFVIVSAPPVLAQDESYAEARAAFNQAPQVQQLLANAYGYALFPTIGKGGIGIGGARGRGKVFRGGEEVGDTTMTQLTVGFQFGGQAFSQIIIFEDEASFNKFTFGNFEFSAQASAVAITASAGAQTGTTGTSTGASTGAQAGSQDGAFTNGMAIFTFAKGGLMYEATLGGQKFTFEPS